MRTRQKQMVLQELIERVTGFKTPGYTLTIKEWNFSDSIIGECVFNAGEYKYCITRYCNNNYENIAIWRWNGEFMYTVTRKITEA